MSVALGALATLVATSAIASCGGDSNGGAGDAATQDAASDAPSSFVDAGSIYDLDATPSEKVRLVFAGCRGQEACHISGAGGLDFPAGKETSDVVNVRSTERPELYRVAPGDRANSYLYLKIVGDGGIDGSRMPPGAVDDPRLFDLVGGWIEAGAM